jgi:putative Holliday junction resolvase
MNGKRILAIDYGKKRTGLAWTDPLQIAPFPLQTIPTQELKTTLSTLFATEPIQKVVIGYPYHQGPKRNSPEKEITRLIHWIQSHYPNIQVEIVDETYSTIEAQQTLMKIGVKKKRRNDPMLTDMMSAVIILRRYLGIYD